MEGRLSKRSHEALKSQDLGLHFSNHFKIWQSNFRMIQSSKHPSLQLHSIRRFGDKISYRLVDTDPDDKDINNRVYPQKYAHGFCFAVLCCGYTLTDFPISIRLTSLALWQSTIAPVQAKQPWWIWINTSCEFIMNNCITTTKQSTTKPCAYFLGYTVCNTNVCYISMHHNL